MERLDNGGHLGTHQGWSTGITVDTANKTNRVYLIGEAFGEAPDQLLTARG